MYNGGSLGLRVVVNKVHNGVKITVKPEQLQPLDEKQYKALEVLYG